MAKLPEIYNIGDRTELTPEYLLFLLERMYTDLVQQINRCPSVYIRTTDGLVTDYQLSNGDININRNTLKVEMLTARPTSTTVIWTQLS